MIAASSKWMYICFTDWRLAQMNAYFAVMNSKMCTACILRAFVTKMRLRIIDFRRICQKNWSNEVYPMDITKEQSLQGFDESHLSLVALGIVVNICTIIQSYILVNKEQQQCVSALFFYGASINTLYSAQWWVATFHSCTCDGGDHQEPQNYVDVEV